MRAEDHWITDTPHGRLAIMARNRAGDWSAEEPASWKSSGVDFVVSLLTDDDDDVVDSRLRHEQPLREDLGLILVSCSVAERNVPDSIPRDRGIDVPDTNEQSEWVESLSSQLRGRK